jgi:hypothetical protein
MEGFQHRFVSLEKATCKRLLMGYYFQGGDDLGAGGEANITVPDSCELRRIM